MKSLSKPRAAMLILFLLLLMGALIWQLGRLTLAEGSYYQEQSMSRRTTTTYSTGARGRILDKNGIPLAYDETSYNVQFLRDPERLTEADSALYTESLITAISIIEAGGGNMIDTFYIRQDEEEPGAYRYDWGVTSPEAIQARYKNFCDAMGIKISDANINDMSKWPSASDAYKRLRLMWRIPPEMPYEQARKIMSIRQEVNMNKWRAYEPVTIAYNVPMNVVAQLEMHADEMLGISTTQSTKRVYPWGSTAAHIIGYMSRQVDNTTIPNLERMGYTLEELKAIEGLYVTNSANEILLDEKTGEPKVSMTRLGYSYNDYIGVAGVERTMERYLTPNTYEHRGVQTLEINKHGTVTRELEKTYAENGNDVMLTIDLDFQRLVESALADNIAYIRQYEESEIEKDQLITDPSKRKYKDPDTIKKAETGSIVVMEVNTGKVLAMASYPSFDPNIFLNPIGEEDYELLFGEGANMPTLNRAIASRTAPGSIFKMSTGLAGLKEGVITRDTIIRDEGLYTKIIGTEEEIPEKDAPSCWAYPRTKSYATHQAGLNLSAALTHSCNYYFYRVANLVGIENLNVWSNRLGLGNPTGIELPGEISGHIGGQETLFNGNVELDQQKSSLPRLIYKHLYTLLRQIAIERYPDTSEKAIESCTWQILALQDGSGNYTEMRENIRRIMASELNIPVTLTRSNNWVEQITSLLTELAWKPAMTIRAGIGQGITVVTPIAVARYASTFANGGTVYDAHVVDRIINNEGATVKIVEPTVYDQIDLPEEDWGAFMHGLQGVVSPEDLGTAAGSFTEEFVDAGYVSMISGKSGTAQISAQRNNIDIENTSWFVTYMPREKPEIVIVTCIPYGMSGSRGSITAVEKITRFYMDRKSSSAKDNLVQVNGLIP